MRSRRSQPFFIQNVLQGISQERHEQVSAQIAAFSCEISLNAIRTGIHNHINNRRKKPNTKYEYNQERVRDFRVGKTKPSEVVPATVDEVADDLEQFGKASYFLLQTDPPPFVRDYDYSVVDDTLKMLNPLHPHFHSIDKLNISNLLIGGKRFALLCEGIAKSSLRTLNISGNKLTNDSMFLFSEKLRSMHQLEDLNISRNKVSDEGIGHLFDLKRYSPTLQIFDCSYNTCNAFAAYYLGMMFRSDRTSQLHTLILGGKVGTKGWGDDFMKVFMCSVIDFGVKRLRHLSIADAGLSEVGLNCLVTLLVCDETVLESLNISKNEFASSTSKVNFTNALRLNNSLKQLSFRQCGFSETHSSHVVSIIHAHSRDSAINRAFAAHSATHRQHLVGEYQLTWRERTAVAYCAAAAWSVCKHALHKIVISFVKDNPWRIPGPPVWQVVRHAAYGSTDLLSNVATIFQNTQVILPAAARAALEDINGDMKYADMLAEALRLCHTMTSDSRSVHDLSQRNATDRTVAEEIEKVDAGLVVTEDRLACYTSMRKAAVAELFREVDQFRIDSEAVLRVAKRRERKSINVIIVEVSQRVNCDRVLFCAENCLGAVMEEGQALEQLIGALHRRKLLVDCLLGENTSELAKPFDFVASVRDSIPYFGNLTSSATFVHYFYLMFGEERKQTSKIKDKALKNLQQELNGSASSKHLSSKLTAVGSAPEPPVDGALGGVSAEVAARRKKNKDRKPAQARRRNVFTQMRRLPALTAALSDFHSPEYQPDSGRERSAACTVAGPTAPADEESTVTE